MSIGVISSPVTWLNGTVLTPTWAQSVQDNINGWMAGTGPTLKSLQIDGTGGNAATVSNGLYMTGGSHIAAIQTTAATGVYGTGAGTTPGALVLGGDSSGVITVVTGTGPVGGGNIIVTVTFNATYPGTAGISGISVIMSPANVSAALLTGATQVFATGNQPGGAGTPWTGWILQAGTSALTASTTYKWNYVVLMG